MEYTSQHPPKTCNPKVAPPTHHRVRGKPRTRYIFSYDKFNTLLFMYNRSPRRKAQVERDGSETNKPLVHRELKHSQIINPAHASNARN